MTKWLAAIALMALPLSGDARADDEGLHLQVLAGFGSYLLHDPFRPDGGGSWLGDEAFDSGPAPPISVHAGASLLPRFALDVALQLRWTRLDGPDDLSRHDTDFWLAGRFYPWRTAGFAPYVDAGAGITNRAVARGATCVFACSERDAALPESTRPLVVAGAGVEWYPFASGFHLLSRLDLHIAVPADGADTDLWLGAHLGAGWRWR